MASRPRLVIFASGTPTGGGTGARNLVLASRGTWPVLNADIVALISNHPNGGVHDHAKELGVPFRYLPNPVTEDDYRLAVDSFSPDFVALSGWLKKVKGLDPRTTFNIHPGPLPLTEGKYGHRVHKAVLEAYARGEVARSAISMHFVTEEYDRGPRFFTKGVPIEEDDTPETLGERVNAIEHQWQPRITNLVVSGKISWDGKDKDSLTHFLFEI